MNLSPLSYLDSAGARANQILPLTRFTLLVAITVCVVIGILLWIAVRRSRPLDRAIGMRAVPIERGGSGLRWIGLGLIISAVPLTATLVWTLLTLAAIAGPPPNPGLVLDVTGHQWWWDVKYDAPRPNETFTTANEIHIPVGVPVLVRLHGGDVIHSFWVPKLSGKTGCHPGADQPQLDTGRQAGALPRSMQRVLRLSARSHAIRGRRRSARGFRPMGGIAAPAGVRARHPG